MAKRNILFILFRLFQLTAIYVLLIEGYADLLYAVLIVGLCYAVFIKIDEIRHVSPFGGIANWVTVSRGLGLLFLLNYFSFMEDYQIVLAGLALAFSDFADGYLARKYKCETTLGAYLDEEMDVFYLIVTAYMLYCKGLSEQYIFLPAILKYIKDIVTGFMPDHFGAPIKMPIARWVAGAALIFYAIAFVLPATISVILLIIICIALCATLVAEVVLRFRFSTENK